MRKAKPLIPTPRFSDADVFAKGEELHVQQPEQAGIDEDDVDMLSVAEVVYREDGTYEELGEYDHAWGPGQTNLPDPV